MTDAPEATSSPTPQAPAAAEPAMRPTVSSSSSQEGRTDASDAATGSDDGHHDGGSDSVADAGTATGAPRARRSRGGRGRRRSGQASPNATGTTVDTVDTDDTEGGADVDVDGGEHATGRQDGRGAVAPTPGATPNPDSRRNGGSGRHQDASRQPRRPAPAQPPAQRQQQQPRAKVHPVLQRLFELYPSMFGARFLPLKLGVYQDLLERHGDELKAEDLKVALGLHARSTRYLDAVAAGHPRHDLEARPVEPVAPEHIHHAILEVFRRRQSRTPDDLSAALRERIIAAIEASGIGRDAYAERVRARDVNGNVALDDALAELGRQGAKREALLRAFETTGKTEAEFADMYGMEPREVTRTLQRARKDKADEQAFAAASAAKAVAAEAAPAIAADQDDEAIDDTTAIDGDDDIARVHHAAIDAQARGDAPSGDENRPEDAPDATPEASTPAKPEV